MSLMNKNPDEIHYADEPLHTPEAETSPAIEITLEEGKALLARAVKEKGSAYVYEQVDWDGVPKCAYFDPKTKAPSCMFGQVLAYKGLTIDDLEAKDTEDHRDLGISLVMGDVNDLVEHGIIKVDKETQALFTIAQGEQDQGRTWGDALAEALATYESVARHYETEGRTIPEDYWL